MFVVKFICFTQGERPWKRRMSKVLVPSASEGPNQHQNMLTYDVYDDDDRLVILRGRCQPNKARLNTFRADNVIQDPREGLKATQELSQVNV